MTAVVIRLLEQQGPVGWESVLLPQQTLQEPWNLVMVLIGDEEHLHSAIARCFLGGGIPHEGVVNCAAVPEQFRGDAEPSVEVQGIIKPEANKEERVVRQELLEQMPIRPCFNTIPPNPPVLTA